jgi:hypothetical protein
MLEVKTLVAKADGYNLVFTTPAGERTGYIIHVPRAAGGREVLVRLAACWNKLAGVDDMDARVNVIDLDAMSGEKLYGIAVKVLADQIGVPLGPWDFDFAKGAVLGSHGAAGQAERNDKVIAKMLDFAAAMRMKAPALAEGVLYLHAENKRLRAALVEKTNATRKGAK